MKAVYVLSSMEFEIEYTAMPKKEKLLTVTEAAKILGKSRQTVHTWAKRGRFPNAKQHKTPIGNYYTIPESDVANFEVKSVGRPKKTDSTES